MIDLSSPSAVVFNNNPYVFFIGRGSREHAAFADNSNRLLYCHYYQPPWLWVEQGAPEWPASSQPPIMNEPPCTLAMPGESNQLFVFVIRNDNTIAVNHWNGNRWIWEVITAPDSVVITNRSLTSISIGNPAIPSLFVIGSDNNLYQAIREGEIWHWQNRGMPPGNTTAPGIFSITSVMFGGRPYVFIPRASPGRSNSLWAFFDSDGSGNYTWAPTVADQNGIAIGPSGESSDPVAFVSAVSYIDSRNIEHCRVFCAGNGSNNLFSCHWDGSWNWKNHGSPFAQPARLISRPSAIVFDNRPHCFFAFDSLHCCFSEHVDTNDLIWKNLGQPENGERIGLPSAITFNNKVYVSVLGMQDFVHHVSWWDGSWHWSSLGGPDTAAP